MVVGYEQLIQRLKLSVRPLAQPASLSGSVNRRINTDNRILFPTGVALEDSLVGHLEFALRHEGVNLEVIDAAFEHIPPELLVRRLQAVPNGESIRRACFLWEWLSGKELTTTATPGAGYVDLFPADLYVTAIKSRRSPKFRVRDNALGNPDFCPTVRLTSIAKNPSILLLLDEANRSINDIADPALYRRAVNYLYLSETRGSYAIERESPSSDKLDRFVQLLRDSGTAGVVDEQRMVSLQNAVVRDVYSQEASYRIRQNWLEDTAGHITFLPAPAADLRRAMSGWEAFVNDNRCPDILVKAACIAFGFVYLHPFMDGNGRLHRFLIHDTFARSGALSAGTILPVSAVILKHIPEYLAVLTAFSGPVTDLWSYQRADVEPVITRSPGSRSYRFFTADREVCFLHDMLCQTVRAEIPREIAWLAAYDEAFALLDAELDLPQKDLGALIRMIHSNDGKLSVHRRKQYGQLPERVLNRIESVVQQTMKNG